LAFVLLAGLVAWHSCDPIRNRCRQRGGGDWAGGAAGDRGDTRGDL